MTNDLPRTILRGPALPNQTMVSKLVRLVLGLVLFLPYLLLGGIAGCPGLRFRVRCWMMAVRRGVGPGRLPLKTVASMIIGPMDSVRYFEFSFVKQCMDAISPRTYLDVSSPRLFPLLHLWRHRDQEVTLLNPDRADLEETRVLVGALGLADACRLEGRLIGESGMTAGTVDLVTSISVVEHIPSDSAALASMWGLLRTGGRLVLTVPCCAKPYEEWADFNKYGLLSESPEGLVFWQRFYSQTCLESHVFSVLGQPARMVVYGEKRAGNYDRNVQSKMHDAFYPIWREPWMMAREWRVFDGIDQMPGVGVVGMMFVKT